MLMFLRFCSGFFRLVKSKVNWDVFSGVFGLGTLVGVSLIRRSREDIFRLNRVVFFVGLYENL